LSAAVPLEWRNSFSVPDASPDENAAPSFDVEKISSWAEVVMDERFLPTGGKER
jgi:hypothetical protein